MQVPRGVWRHAPHENFFILTTQSPLSWVSQPFRQDIGQFLLRDEALQLGKFFLLYICYEKSDRFL